MSEVGYATLGIIPSFDGFQRRLESGTSRGLLAAGTSGGTAFGDAAGKSAGQRFGSVFKTAAKASLIGLAGAGALAFKVGQDSVSAASDLNESLNAVNVTYGKQAKAVKKLGRESAETLGLSNSEFNGLAVQYSAFAKTIGGDKKTVRTLDDLTSRASDFASVMNLEVGEAATLFQSGLAGETEPLRRFGIDLSAASVQAFAYSEGIAKSGEELTEAQKVQARYASLMAQTNKTQGDFANTSGELANQQRILSSRFEDAKARLGTALLPILSEATDFLIDKGIPAFEDFADWFTEKGIPKLEQFGGFVKDEIFPVLSDLADFAGDAAGFVGDLIGFINKLPGDAKLAALGAALTGGGLVKAQSGSGALGAVGKVAGFAKPTPVVVTNWAQIGAAGGGGVVTGTPTAKGGSKLSRFAKGGAALVAGALAFAFGDDAAEAYMDGFERNSSWYTRTQRHFDSVFGESTKSAFGQAAQDVTDYAKAYDKIPETLQSRFNLLGVPETEGQLRHLLRVYDIAAKDRRTTLELLGYEPLLDRISRINKELDWAARPREARIAITKVYGQAGYETRGGLQEGGGGPVTRSRSRSGGGLG